MSKASKPATQTVNRSSISGRFVTQATAKRHPATTETQRIKTGK